MKSAGLLLLLTFAGQGWAQSPRISVWHRDQAGYHADATAGDAPLAVGSLQKPFVAKAWALAHPDASSPRILCGRASGCWLKSGHGELGLATALAVSCNTYFRELAQATPMETLGATLRDAGFLPSPTNAEEAIGLAAPRLLRIRPSRLLEELTRLVREPWVSGEAFRAEVLAGLRESALLGTAGSLGHRGYWAKTGTVPMPGASASRTVGLVAAVDDAGFAVLARRAPGTGTKAAAELGAVLDRLRPGSALHAAEHPSVRSVKGASPRIEGQVRVRLFDLFGRADFTVRNLGTSPVAMGRGFLGAGSVRALADGDRVGPGLLELRSESRGLCRRIEGEVRRSASGQLVATVPLKAYVEGVLAGELPANRMDLKAELGAAILRFLSDGPRHGDVDVCDATHCAWFLGRGPRLDWKDPRRAVEVEGSATAPIAAEEWEAMRAAASRPGPRFWTGHCGGRPLSPKEVWGSEETTVLPCARHAEGAHAWTRPWRREDVDRAFGGPVTRLAVEHLDGQWVLRVWRGEASQVHAYDEAHRRLAAVLGWSALPSPADRVEATQEGWRATGVGLGHRVGLCLGD